eukprot:Nk52_evm1s209 gene=Nk52_evmTU1s209
MTKILAASNTKSDVSKILSDTTYEEDKLMDELENEDEPAYIREKRLEALKMHLQSLQEMQDNSHGDYSEVEREKDFLTITTKTSKLVVCHFYHKEFERCKIMDRHVHTLARKHFKVKFIKLDVEKCGFIVDKLKIKTLPAVYCFRNGIVIDRLVGFEDLGGTDKFTTDMLEKRLASCGIFGEQMMAQSSSSSSSSKGKIFGRPDKSGYDDDEDDWA